MFPAQQAFPPPPSGFTSWHVVALVGADLLFFLLLAIIILWYRDRKSRRLHEQHMQALERGLNPSEWGNQSERSGRRMGWLWLAVGLPVFIAFAGGIGTALLTDASMRSNRNMMEIMVTIWIVGGVVALAAVIMGGLGMIAEQRRQARLPPPLEYPSVRPAPVDVDKSHDPATERIWKQEGS